MALEQDQDTTTEDTISHDDLCWACFASPSKSPAADFGCFTQGCFTSTVSELHGWLRPKKERWAH